LGEVPDASSEGGVQHALRGAPVIAATAQRRAPLVHEHRLGERLAGGRDVNLDPIAPGIGRPHS